MELEGDLRVASDRMLQHARAARTRSRTRSATLTPGSRRFQTLATEIERLAAVVFAQTPRPGAAWASERRLPQPSDRRGFAIDR